MKIEITKFGTTPQKMQQIIDFKFITVKDGLIALGGETRDYMRNTIKQGINRSPSSGNLENSIESYPDLQPKNVSVGIGKIPVLNELAPYWKIINYGGFIPAAQGKWTLLGYWGNYNPSDVSLRGSNPGGGGKEDFFLSRSQNTFGNKTFFAMKPRNRINGKNYIEKTTNWATTIWKIHFYNWTKKTQVATR